MREIKFRAWHKKEKWMGVVVGMDISHKRTENPEVNIVTMDYEGDSWDAETYPLKDVELMQYTGLKDKKGVKIYEGDILKLDSWTGIQTVEFIEGAFCLVTHGIDFDYPVDIHYINHAGIAQSTIIGDIYKNPELLKESVE